MTENNCTCRDCGRKFDGPACLHEYVAPICPDCDSDDIDEQSAEPPVAVLSKESP